MGRRLAVWLAPLLLSACRGVQTTLDPAADQAGHIDVIWRVMLAVCGLMYLAVMGFLAWALWRAQRVRDDAPSLGETSAEPGLRRGLAAWTGLVVAGLVLLATVSFLVDRSLAEAAPDPLRVKVTANQWWWRIDYPGDAGAGAFATANELHLPVDRPAVIELEARDVIHSFWIPNLSGKTDLIPGRVNHMAVRPRRVGVFRGQCAEFCGLQHAQMAFDVQVDSPAAFETWRRHQASSAAAPSAPDPALGQRLFAAKGCGGCHGVRGTNATGAKGPDLTHFAGRAHLAAGALANNRGDLQAWIADPQGIKPGAQMPRMRMSAEELNAISAYLESLG